MFVDPGLPAYCVQPLGPLQTQLYRCMQYYHSFVHILALLRFQPSSFELFRLVPMINAAMDIADSVYEGFNLVYKAWTAFDAGK